MIEFLENITEAVLTQHPEKIFVFGDNLLRKGYGGQAKVCRGKPNCFGIPTKRAPDNRPESFFTDADYPEVIELLTLHFLHLRNELQNGKTVVWPAFGIGTGLANLPWKAPKIYRLIYQELMKLIAEFGYTGYYLGPTPREESCGF